MAKKRTENDGAFKFGTKNIDDIDHAGYLGNPQVASSLLRDFVGGVMTDKVDYSEAAVRLAHPLAKIFLGQDPGYPGLEFNQPGCIDAYLAKEIGIGEPDPERRICVALFALLNELFAVQKLVAEQQLIKEQWQPEVDAILEQYTNLFLGLPRGGWEEEQEEHAPA